MIVSRRYSSEAADFIEKIEQHRGAPRLALETYLAALLINHSDDLPPQCHAQELLGATTWMTELGRLEWERQGDETIVRYRECLN